jgi:glyoxylase-like metal-dependent hydrolase (beta-lactamase superfamily II)
LDESVLAASVETVLGLPETTEIFPGHGGKTTVGAERKLRMK